MKLSLILIIAALTVCYGSQVGAAIRYHEPFEKLLPPEPRLPGKVCTVLKAQLKQINGVLPDSVDQDPKLSNPDARRLQEAMNKCPAGQAVKLVADGKQNAFLAGPLMIPSEVTFWVDKGVTLFASRSPADYDLGDGICGDALPNTKNRCQPWISALDTDNSGIVGEGTIDGRGGSILTSGRRAFKATWWDLSIQSKAKGEAKLQQNNPRMIQVTGGSNFTFYKITIQNAPKFHIGTAAVNRVTAWGIKILTPSLAYTVPNYACGEGTFPVPGEMKVSTCFTPELVKNTDGFDPATSKNVTLAYSYISTGDDNVAIKSGLDKNRPASENHLYAHNRFYYGHGMSIGSETDAGVDNIKIWDLTIDGYDSGHGVGLRIKTDGKRGGEIQNVVYHDVCMRRVKDSLLFSPYYSSTKKTDLPPNIHDITLRNYHYVDYPGGKYNKSKVTFSGYKAAELLNPLKITLDNVVFDTLPELRTKHHHDVEFVFGPGPVVNLPAETGNTIRIIDKRAKDKAPQALPCPDEVFIKYPSDASPI